MTLPPTIAPSASPTATAIQTPSMTIKLLNGTGRIEETQKIQKLLTDAGFQVATTENALNLYDSSVIYYQPAFENYANQIANLLGSYSAKTQKLNQENKYDVYMPGMQKISYSEKGYKNKQDTNCRKGGKVNGSKKQVL